MFSKIFEWADLQPWCQIIEEQEDFPSCIEFIHYELGEHRLLGILDSYNSGILAGTPKTPRNILVKLSKSYYVYNMRINQYLGYINQVPLITEPGTANLLYLSECEVKVQNFAVTQPTSAKRGEVITVNISGPVNKLHVVRVEVIAPSGEVVTEYCSNVVLENGSGKMKFPFSLNDELRIWTICVRDVASGVMLKKQIELNR